MSNTNWGMITLLVVASLIVGGLFTWAFWPREVVDTSGLAEANSKIISLEAQLDKVPATQLVNSTVTVTEADADLFRKKAVTDIFEQVGDEHAFQTCGGYEYDSDEITLTDFAAFSYGWAKQSKRDTDYVVTFEADTRFKTADEHACHATRTYKVTYEKNEDPSVKFS